MTTPSETTKMADTRTVEGERDYGVDYQINGTLVLNCKNWPAARLQAQAILDRAKRDLENLGSMYCEVDRWKPFDLQEKCKSGVSS